MSLTVISSGYILLCSKFKIISPSKALDKYNKDNVSNLNKIKPHER